jgi:uncharacterized protein
MPPFHRGTKWNAAVRGDIRVNEGKFARLYIIAAVTLVTVLSQVPSVSMAQEVAAAKQATPPTRYEEKKRESNGGTVSIIGSQASTPYTRFAEDIQNILDEPENNGLRILPILGRGGGQNFMDILFVKGVDMGFVEQDVITYFKKKDPKLFASVENRVQFIFKVSNSETHVFVRPEIKTLEDLRGKKVSFYKQLSSSAIAIETILETCKIKVEPIYVDTDLGNDMLKKGEIAALSRVSGAPHNAFASLTAADGHFLPLDEEHMPAGCYDKLSNVYLPAVLKNEHYPKLIPEGTIVPTFGNGTLLAVYSWPENSERYRKISHFVTRFFDNIEKFRTGPRHPKWKDVNLAADVPGWVRFKPAQQWLAAHKPSSAATSDADRAAFKAYLSEKPGSENMNKEQRDALFKEFLKWQQSKKRQ